MSRPTGKNKSAKESSLGWMAQVCFLLVGGLLVFGFAWMLQPAVEKQKQASCQPMEPKSLSGAAPELSLQDLEGNELSLADFRGKFVVLNFWATWCEPCIREWPELAKLTERLGGREDIVVLAVSVDENREDIAPFIERMNIQNTGVKVLWDPSQQANLAFGTSKLPDTYFVDQEGQLHSVFVNVRDWGRSEALACVESVAAQLKP